MVLRKRRLLWIVPVTATVLAVTFWYLVVPYPRSLDDRKPETTALMEQRQREAAVAGRSLTIRQDWVDLAQISSNLQRAVVIAEDWRFREHAGVDWRALASVSFLLTRHLPETR